MCNAYPDISQATQPLLLRGRNLGISLGQQRILDGVDLDLYAGDVVLLRGANGSGKTTLLNVLTGHLSPDTGSLSFVLPGSHACWRFPQSLWCRFHPRKSFNATVMAQQGIARVWQDIRLFSNLTLMENVAVALTSQRGVGPAGALFRRRWLREQQRHVEDAATELLSQIGMAHQRHVKAAQVSLGQAKRTAIVRAMAGQAPVLFLDEPLAGLDQDGCQAVIALLQTMLSRRPMTLVMIEHPSNADLLRPLVRSVWTLEQGQLFVAPATVRDQPPLHDTPRMSALQTELGQRGLSVLRRYPLAGGGRLTVFGSAPPQGQPLLQLANVRVGRNGRMVTGTMQPFSLALHEGETALLEAPNGWGKTTLLEAIAGVHSVQEGQIIRNGVCLQHVTASARAAAGVGFVQSRHHVFPGLSVRETLQLSQQAKVPELLIGMADRMASALSGGERQLLALCSVLGNHALGVRLLDEPFSALDDATRARVMAELWPASGANLIAVPSRHHSGA